MSRKINSHNRTDVFIDGDEISIYSKMLDKRIIFIDDELLPEFCNLIKAQLLYLDSISNDDITLMIDSPGGDIYTSLGLIDTMDMVKSDIITINIGLCASMAAIILSCGTKGKRKSLKRSRVMIHQPLTSIEGYKQATDIEIESKEMNSLKKELYEILSERTGQTYKKVKKNSERDYYLTTKKALKYGIIDIIL